MERRTAIVELAPTKIASLVADVLPGACVRDSHLLHGGRANTSYLLELTPPHPRCVLRLYVRAAATCAKEVALSGLLGASVPIPRILGQGSVLLEGAPIPFALLEFANGRALEAVIAERRSGEPPLASAGRALGLILGRLRRFGFERSGDLVAEAAGALRVQPWGFGDDDALGFLHHCLFDTAAAARLGVALRDRLWHFARERAARWPDLARERRLVHGDFGPANLVVRAEGASSWAVQGVIDWEFAHSGSPLSDVGNLLRSRSWCPLPPDFPEQLALGMAEEGVDLPPDWRDRAAYLDLSSACEFLSSTEERPRVHAAAREQIETLLARWSG